MGGLSAGFSPDGGRDDAVAALEDQVMQVGEVPGQPHQVCGAWTLSQCVVVSIASFVREAIPCYLPLFRCPIQLYSAFWLLCRNQRSNTIWRLNHLLVSSLAPRKRTNSEKKGKDGNSTALPPKRPASRALYGASLSRP